MIVWLAGFLIQDIDNPQFALWSASRAGSWVTLKRSTTKATTGDAVTLSESETTYTVVENSADKVVLKVTGKAKIGEAWRELEAYTSEIPAKIPKPDAESGAKLLRSERGEEEVEASGRKLKCRWIEEETEQGGVKTTTKTWSCDEVPGGIVRVESSTEGSSQSVLLRGFDKK